MTSKEDTGDQRVELTIDTLFTIYVAGFNHGANEGPFPEHGVFQSFERLLKGEPYRGDNSARYNMPELIKYI